MTTPDTTPPGLEPPHRLRPITDQEPPEDYPEPRPITTNGVDRTPPNDRASEQAVLGAALLNRDTIQACASIITAADFYHPQHETIWRALTHLHGHDAPTDPAAVASHLLDTGDLAKAGGPLYLTDLLAGAPVTPTDATWHATRVDALSRRRQAITRLDRTLHKLRLPGPDTDVDDLLHGVTNDLLEARDQLTNPPAATTWTPVALDAVLSGDYLDPPPTMLNRTDGVRLFYAGAVHSVAGESESGKTWLCLLACLQEIQAGNRVVFVDFEDRADRVIGRLMALGATPDMIREHFAYIRPDRPLDDDGRAQLAPALHGATLVILDGVTEAMTMHGFDLNSNSDSALFQGLLPRWIADHGPAVALIDHVVKSKEEQGRFALGAQHKLAGIDGVAYIVKMIKPFARNKRGLAQIRIGKDRPGHVREHAFGDVIAEFTLDALIDDVLLIAELAPPGHASGKQGEAWEPTHIMEKASRYIQLNPGLSKKAIEGAMNGKIGHIRTALELLTTRGYISTSAGQRGAIIHHHVKPFYADGDPYDGQPNPDPEHDTTDTQE